MGVYRNLSIVCDHCGGDFESDDIKISDDEIRNKAQNEGWVHVLARNGELMDFCDKPCCDAASRRVVKF